MNIFHQLFKCLHYHHLNVQKVGMMCKDCMKKFCESLGKHAIKLINFKKEKNEVIKKEHLKPYEIAKICYICKEKLEDKYVKYKKLRDRSHYYGEYREIVHSICNLKYSVLKKNSCSYS